MELNKIHNIDALSGLKQLPDKSINCVVTSPPYWSLRGYLKDEDPNKSLELGREPYFRDYIENLAAIFKEVYRVLRDDGCCFVNLGDTYFSKTKGTSGRSKKQLSNSGSFTTPIKLADNGIKETCLCNIPYRFAIKMTDELGWINRNLIIWYKRNAFVTSTTNRFTVDFEPIFFFTKSNKYYFEQQFDPYSTKYNYNETYTGQATKDYAASGAQKPSDAKRRILKSIQNGKGKNKRCVFDVTVKPSGYKHTATFPPDLITPLIKAGCPPNGIVLDPFAGIFTTGLTSKRLGRQYLGFELSLDYCKIAEERLKNEN